MLSSSSAPLLRSSPPGRFTERRKKLKGKQHGISSNLRKEEVRRPDETGYPPSISFVAPQPPFPQLHRQSHHCTLKIWCENNDFKWLTENLVFTGVTDISLFTLSTTPARLAHKTCSSFVKSFHLSKSWAFMHLLSRCHVCAMTSHEARIPDQFGLSVDNDVQQLNRGLHLDKMRLPCNDITRSHKMCRFLFFTFSHHL